MTQLHDLWKEYDKTREHLLTLDERRDYWQLRWKEGEDKAAETYPDVHQTNLKMGELMLKIRSKERDWVKDLTELFEEDIKTSSKFATDVWSALANVEWRHEDGTRFSCSWRAAGGIIARIRGEDKTDGMAYMNWYMSGPDAVVSDEIQEAFKERGWTHDADSDGYS